MQTRVVYKHDAILWRAILTYYILKVHTFLLWANYLLSQSRSMWIGMQPTWTPNRETHLAGLETEVDVCLFTEASGRLDALLQFSLTHTHSSMRDLFTWPGAKAYRHSLLTYITTTCPRRHWSLSQSVRTNEREKNIQQSQTHKLPRWDFVNTQINLWTILKNWFAKMNQTSQRYHSLRLLKDPIKCGKRPVHPLLMFNGASKTGTAPKNWETAPNQLC